MKNGTNLCSWVAEPVSRYRSLQCTGRVKDLTDACVRPAWDVSAKKLHAIIEESLMLSKVCKWASVLGAMTFAFAIPGCDQVSSLLSTVLSGITGGN
jgi:hypothetical protein